MSAMEDSNSGDETYSKENEGPESPRSESQSRSSSPAPGSPASPRSPSSPQEQDTQGNPESPPSSPSSSRSSPSSPAEHKSSPRSPASPGSPASANVQSDREASDVEMSDAEEADTKENDNEENADKSGDERSHSEAEDSDREENIPEVNIDSGDENDNKSEQNVSENEGEQSGDEDDKDDQRSVHVDSDAENKSDDEDAANKSDDEEAAGNERGNEDSSPKRSSSPIQAEKDAEDSDDEEIKRPKKKDNDAEDNADSDSDAESVESEVGGLIADIFGESDEEEEFEGFNEEDIAAGKATKEEAKPKKEKRKRAAIMSDSEDEKDEEKEKEENEEDKGVIEDVPAPPDDEDGEVPEEPPAKKKKPDLDDSDDEDDGKLRDDRADFVSDFDLMMQKKKEESSTRRKRRDVDLISDSDDLIADIIAQMRMAAEEDKELNKVKRTATKKLKILPMVLSQLKKQDLKMAFLDQGVLNVIAEWLTPLPDRSLPHLNIREGMLKQLSDYPNFDPSLLKSSGIGRALMYLFKHPRETKENRARAGKLITEWARPIFNVTTNYHALTKEEREQRDYDHIPKRRKNRDQGTSEADEPEVERKDIEKEMTGEKTAIRPGDKGWIGRARVPLPSTKDYVNRPKWNVEMEFGRGPSKKPLTRIEKHMRSLQDKKRLNKQQRAITISIEGRKMAI